MSTKGVKQVSPTNFPIELTINCAVYMCSYTGDPYTTGYACMKSDKLYATKSFYLLKNTARKRPKLSVT
jgi:hypothetical protein